MVLGAVSLLGVPLIAWTRIPLADARRPPASGPPDRAESSPKGLLTRGFITGCVGPGLVISTLGFILRESVGDSISFGTVVVGVATLNGVLLASRHVINTVGAPLLGHVLDRMGHDRGAFVFFSAATVALFLATAWSACLPVLVVLILAFFVCGTAVQVVLAAQAGASGSRAFASYATASDFGAATGPLLGWTVFEFVASPVVALAMGGAITGVGAVLSWRSARAQP